jgi:hypothetical protein
MRADLFLETNFHGLPYCRLLSQQRKQAILNETQRSGNMDRLESLKAAYEILESITPLRKDCGSLCQRACCSSACEEEEETGMYLFPGEEELLAGNADWLSIACLEQTSPGLYLARCKGTCPRSLRPLACRIFPLTPYLTKDEILLVKMDPRANPVCPLARSLNRHDLRPEFVTAVRKASLLLIGDPSIKAFIAGLSRMLDSYVNTPWYQLEKRK